MQCDILILLVGGSAVPLVCSGYGLGRFLEKWSRRLDLVLVLVLDFDDGLIQLRELTHSEITILEVESE